MSQSPDATITSVRTLPESPGPTADLPGFVSIGLVLDDGRVFWGVCPVAGQSSAGRAHHQVTTHNAIQTVEQSLRPCLSGRSPSEFLELSSEIDALTETVTITEALDEPDTPKVSRRAFFTGRVDTASRRPSRRTVTVERPVHAALRYAVSEALVKALAAVREQSVAQVIADLYELPLDRSAMLLQADASAVDVDAAVAYDLNALGYTIEGVEPKVELGANAEHLQQFARRLTAKLAISPAGFQPVIHLNLRGGLGALYDDDVGRMLGTLYGLEQTIVPYKLRVQDPLLTNARPARIDKLAELKDLLRLRKMNVQVAAGWGIADMEDLDAYLRDAAVHTIVLEIGQLGTLHQTITALKACREAGVAVLLQLGGSGALESATRLGIQVAMAARPDLLGVHGLRELALVGDEIGRIATAGSLRTSPP